MSDETLFMITPLYAAVFVLFFIFLSVNTLLTRRRLNVGVGDGGNQQMLRAVRAHGNFSEYVPFALLLILMLEQYQPPALLIHGLCLALLVGRLSHAFGITKIKENFAFRVFGMSMTFTVLALSALAIFVKSLAVQMN